MESSATDLTKKNQPERGLKETSKTDLLNISKISAFACHSAMAVTATFWKSDFYILTI